MYATLSIQAINRLKGKVLYILISQLIKFKLVNLSFKVHKNTDPLLYC